jgi:N-acylglucosamine-6-phosphate 2-epimerase
MMTDSGTKKQDDRIPNKIMDEDECSRNVKLEVTELRSELLKKIEKKIIVSCQALEDEPLHGRGMMVLMAKAAIMGGAAAIRANGAQDIEDIKSAFDIPLIGLNKRNIEGYPVYITPTSEDALSVLRAGADVVAIDCTLRKRPEGLDKIFAVIRREFPGKKIMADISSIEDAREVSLLKPDFLATTLSGYTDETLARPKPDIRLVEALVEEFDIPIIAEGNYWEPEQVLKAFEAGAFSVTLGSVITRPQLITKKFTSYLEDWKKSRSQSGK